MKKTVLLLLLAACSDKSDADYKVDVTSSMHASIAADLADLTQAAKDLQAAAPTHAWADSDVTAMRAAWKRTRIAYEHVEGATAPIFPNLDGSMDARYDDFLVEGADDNLFDAQGVTGMHAIERILFAQDIRQEVIDFEKTLPGYKAAAYPTNDTEATAFKTELAQKLIDDSMQLESEWKPAAIDIGAAYQGLVGLMNEQAEKVNLAATGEEESRYANITLFDLRTNLEGTRKIYALFQPWIQSKDGGDAADMKIEAELADLATLYAQNTGDNLPAVPADWSSDSPSAANLATPFGKLWGTVHEKVDPTRDGSVVFEMNLVAGMLGFPEFVSE
jgi:iron uptake system component EfeO